MADFSIQLIASPRSEKKWRAKVNGKSVDFGQKGASDYTLHKDSNRKDSYLSRHAGNSDDGYLTSRREDWTITGLKTAGFWSRWLTWNLPTIEESIADIERRFDVSINFDSSELNEVYGSSSNMNGQNSVISTIGSDDVNTTIPVVKAM